MKKYFTLILAVSLLTLTACSNSGESSSSVASNEEPSVISSVPEAESSAAPESSETSVDDDPVIIPDDPDNPANPGGVDNSALELPDNRAGRMIKAALDSYDWSYMMLLDEDMIAAVTGVDPADLDEYACIMPEMSGVPCEAYCFKPKDGKASAVRTALSALVDAKKDDHMLYPMVQEAWANAVLEEDGGYVYLVVHPDSAQEIADTMGATK